MVHRSYIKAVRTIGDGNKRALSCINIVNLEFPANHGSSLSTTASSHCRSAYWPANNCVRANKSRKDDDEVKVENTVFPRNYK